MGNPKEKTRPVVEKLVEVSLGNGSLSIPFHFGRQPVSSDRLEAKLDGYLLAGAKVANPSWKIPDEAILQELSVIANHPLDRVPFISLGFVLSEEGFGKYNEPFKSLSDPDTREVFRAIADPIVNEPWYNPSGIARKALFRDNITYSDGIKREWDSGELVSILTIVLAERGRVFSSRDEHATRISKNFNWPADLAEMLGIAYLTGKGEIKEAHKGNAISRLKEDLQDIERSARNILRERDKEKLMKQINSLAGHEIFE